MLQGRRRVLGMLGGALAGASLPALAQQSAKVPRIGILVPTTQAGWASRIEAFRAGMRDAGYVEGRNLALEIRSVENRYQHLPTIAGELAQLKVDVIVTAGTPGTAAAKKATSSIPIVMAAISDPVATGLVQSLARPRGNVTGLMFFVEELNTKRLELLREAVPRLTRVAAMMNADNASMVPVEKAMVAAAPTLRIDLHRFNVRRPEDFASSFNAMSDWGAQALIVVEDSMLNVNAAALGAIATARGLPSIGPAEVAAGGGLVGYGVNQLAMFRRAALYVDRLLKGAKPADMAIERSTTFEFVINLSAARALGLSISQAMRLRADRVIE